VCIVIGLTICTLNSDFRQIPFAPDLPKRNLFAVFGVPICKQRPIIDRFANCNSKSIWKGPDVSYYIGI
jgi:hypothetical protein